MKKQSFRKALVWNVIIITLLSNTVFGMYDPVMMRFTSRDPVKGNPKEPLTVHKYLYTANDPMNRIDPTGRSMASILVEPIMAGYSVHGTATTVAAIGVANMNWNMISFGIALERTILPVMALSVVMRKGGLRHEKESWKVLNGYEQGANSNMGGGGWNNLPKWAAIGTALVLIAAEMRGCDEELQGISDFLELLNGDNEENSQFEPNP